MGCLSRRDSSTSSEVEYCPVLVLRCLVRDFEFFEEHGADLFRRGDGKLVPGQCVDFLLERVQSGAEVVAGLAKCFGVEAHAVLFHAGEDGQQGHFDLGNTEVTSLSTIFRGAGGRGAT